MLKTVIIILFQIYPIMLTSYYSLFLYTNLQKNGIMYTVICKVYSCNKLMEKMLNYSANTGVLLLK